MYGKSKIMQLSICSFSVDTEEKVSISPFLPLPRSPFMVGLWFSTVTMLLLHAAFYTRTDGSLSQIL